MVVNKESGPRRGGGIYFFILLLATGDAKRANP